MKNYITIIVALFTISINAQQNLGDIKLSFRKADHNGWYLLDGRSVSSLPSTAQTAASGLGLTVLPDARGKYLKGKATVQAIGAVGGANTITLTQAHLPAFNFTPTITNTNTTGSHTHTVEDYTPVYDSNGDVAYRPNAGTNFYEPGTTLFADVATSTNGAHTHSISLPLNTAGAATPLSIEPNNITTNTYIYLGE